MCGISGIVSVKDALSGRLRKESVLAAKRLQHRGPDFMGIWENDQSVIIHNKLSILDFSDRSNQPVKTPISIVSFNGEIYNYKDVANKFGLNLNDMHSDAFVIAHVYNMIGIDVLKEIHGDFAIAIYDMELKRLFLARDRLGVKQIVYHYKNDILRFSSEAKSFLEYSDIKLSPNMDRLMADLMMSFWADKGDTYFNYVHHVLPGHYLELGDDGLKEIQYWDLDDVPNRHEYAGLTDNEMINCLDNLLLQSTHDRLIGEAKLGTLLSGGLDSSILTAIIAKSDPNKKVQAYTILYDEGEENRDYQHAMTVVEQYPNIDHKANNVRQNDMSIENLDLITYHMEEVIWDKVYWSMFTNYKNAAHDGLRVIINGQGSDEVWLGYYHDFPHYKFDEDSLSISNLTNHFIEKNQAIFPFLNHDTFKAEKVKELIQDTLDKNFEPYKNEDVKNAIAAWATKTYLQSNLMQEDRMSMASSVECRVPFTDHRFVEAAFSIPSSIKARDGVEKWPLKQVGRKHLPVAICERQKMAFVNPSSRYNDQAHDYLIKHKDEIKNSAAMRELFGPHLFESLESNLNFPDAEFPWKIVAIHRFMKAYNF